MADPISWMMLAGAAVAAVGAVSQANAQKAAHSYNAKLAERDAMVATEQAHSDSLLLARKASQDQGSLIAGYGASGVATDEGSPMDVLRMSVANAKLDEGTMLYKGRLKATGYYDSATLERMGGTVAQEQGYLNASSYLLSGVGRAGSTYAAGQSMKNPGPPTRSQVLYED